MQRFLFLCAALVFGCLALGGSVAAESPTKVELEAALLYKFSKFVSWPEGSFEDARAPLIFGVLADEEGLPAALEAVLEGQTVKGRPVIVEIFDDLASLGHCHLLFVDPAGPSERRVLKKLDGAPVLLVGFRPHFARRGGAINFYERGGSLRFEINPDAGHRAELEISSKLLRLARVVKDSDR